MICEMESALLANLAATRLRVGLPCTVAALRQQSVHKGSIGLMSAMGRCCRKLLVSRFSVGTVLGLLQHGPVGSM